MSAKCQKRTLADHQVQILIESLRRHNNTLRPHSSLGYRPPAPEVMHWQAKPRSSGTLPVTLTLAPRPHLN